MGELREKGMFFFAQLQGAVKLLSKLIGQVWPEGRDTTRQPFGAGEVARAVFCPAAVSRCAGEGGRVEQMVGAKGLRWRRWWCSEAVRGVAGWTCVRTGNRGQRRDL